MRAAVLSLILFSACTRSFIRDESKVEIRRDIPYAVVDDQPLKLDLYLPARRPDPAPLVVWMHGGSWVYGTHHDCRIDWLAEEGFAVASIAYRKSLEAKWPAQLHDVKAAVRWLRAHGTEHGVRTDRIAATGMSSGAHLALMLGLTANQPELEGDVGDNLGRSSAVQAVISYYGPTDLAWYGRSTLANLSAQPIPLLLGETPEENPERAKKASPLYRIGPGSPPVLLIHGEDDFVVPKAQSQEFHERYRAASLNSQLVLVADAGHYGGSRYFGRDGPRKPVLEFLHRWIGE
jgi:acetyl esterase/lipase